MPTVNFPTALDSWANRVDGVDDNIADDQNTHALRIIAVETKVGIDGSDRDDTNLEGRIQEQEQRLIVGSTEPSTPVTHDLWLDTGATPPTLFRWTGSAWEMPGANALSLYGLAIDSAIAPADGDLLAWDDGASEWVAAPQANARWLNVTKFDVT